MSDRNGDFIPINVAGLDDNVFADTLFGHKKGAFTGADQARSGLIEKASGGTLFLDEIGDLSPSSQIKLLRLLQDGDFFPLELHGQKHVGGDPFYVAVQRHGVCIKMNSMQSLQ